MNVSLTPELEAFVHRKVESGMYNSASEVIRESLRLLDQKDRTIESRRAELMKELEIGLADLKAGRVRVIETKEDYKKLSDEIKIEGRKRLEARRIGLTENGKS
ncbi:MAG TPA: type II toxin-antitoxin system ParD family antitoxin [Pyrinomonadaceae bacterium]|nr:type II toxin-antitoxin system ParD family antitoxin [Pyrinomonadaceae bacterium]